MNDINVDKKVILSLKDLFKEGFNDFVALYFSDFEKKEKELLNCIQKSELEAAKKIAHALKGNSMNVGATDLATLCENIEIAIQKGDPPQIADACQNLQNNFPLVKTAYLHLTSTF